MDARAWWPGPGDQGLMTRALWSLGPGFPISREDGGDANVTNLCCLSTFSAWRLENTDRQQRFVRFVRWMFKNTDRQQRFVRFVRLKAWVLGVGLGGG